MRREYFFNNRGETINMKKFAVLAVLSVLMFAGAAAQTDAGYEYTIQNKYFEPANTVQNIDSSGDYAAAVTFEPSSPLDNSIFMWKNNKLKWSASHRTTGKPRDIAVNSRGVILGFDNGDRGMIPSNAETIPDEPIIFAQTNGATIDVAQSEDVIFSATDIPGTDTSALQLYDADTVYNEGNSSYAGGSSILLDSANDASFQEIEYSQGKLYTTTQKAGLQESQLRIYTVEDFNDITESKVVNFTELATDITVNNGEAAILFNDGVIKQFSSKGKEQTSLSFSASSNADDIGMNNRHILVYGTSIMYAVNPDTENVNELFNIDRALKPVNTGDWLTADGNTITYTPEQNLFREEGSFGEGGLSALAAFMFEDLGGFSSENAKYAAAFSIILITTGSMALLAGATGALFGGALGITISSAVGLLPIEIIFIMMAIAALGLYSRLTGSGGGSGSSNGDI